MADIIDIHSEVIVVQKYKEQYEEKFFDVSELILFYVLINRHTFSPLEGEKNPPIP